MAECYREVTGNDGNAKKTNRAGSDDINADDDDSRDVEVTKVAGSYSVMNVAGCKAEASGTVDVILKQKPKSSDVRNQMVSQVPDIQPVNITGCDTVNIMLKQDMLPSDVLNQMDVMSSIIKQYRNDNANLFVPTKGFDASVITLLKHHTLMVIGAPGSGKTMIAQQLMVRLCDEMKCHPFRLTKPTEYCKNWNPEILQCFHIDDAFGSTNFVEGKYIGWVSVVGKMRDDLRCQNTYIIFTSRDNIWNENSSDLKNYEIFSHVINLSADNFKLTEMNMSDIFDNHARVNQLGIVYKDIVEPKQTKEDSDKTMEEPMGYPQRVRLVCSMKDVTKDAWLRYIRHPMEYLSDIIASYREKDHLSYCVLVLLLINDGKLPKSFFHHSNKSSEQVKKSMDICRLPTSTTTMGDLHATAEHLCGSFLILNDDCFVAQHESIMEAAALDFGKNNPTDILNLCSIQFLVERVFTKDSTPPDNEYVVILSEKMFLQLCERLIKEIQGCLGVRHRNWSIRLYHRIWGDASSNQGDPVNLRSISAYRVFRDSAFFCVFLGRLQLTHSFHLLLTSSSRDSQHPTFLFLTALSGQAAFIHEVLSSYRCLLPGLSDHLDLILYAACHSGSPAAVHELLVAGSRADYRTAHQPDQVRDGRWEFRRRCTTLMHAAYSGSVEVLQRMTSHLQQQCVDVAEHVGIRDVMGRTALHWWAEGRREASALQILLDTGADVNARSQVGQTALHWSAGERDEAAVRALLQVGAHVNLRINDSQTELVRIRDGQPMIRMKANPDASDELGRTAIHLSAQQGDEAIVRLLVAAGADIHLRASTPPWLSEKPGWRRYTNKTPLELAVLRKRTAVATYLRSLPPE